MHSLLKTLTFFALIIVCSNSYSESFTRVPEGYPLKREGSGGNGIPNELVKAFKGKANRYPYFSSSIAYVYDEKSSDGIDPAFPMKQSASDLSLFKKIKDISGLDELGNNSRSQESIDQFLSQNYRSQVLPEKAYDNGDVPKPLYVSDLKRSSFEAVANGDLNSLRALLDNYNLLSIKDEEGFNLLLHSILHSQYEIAEFLIKRGINLNEVNKYGASGLIIAARNNDMKMVKLLALMRLKINTKDRFGNTALDYSLMNKNKEMYEYLLSLAGSKSIKK